MKKILLLPILILLVSAGIKAQTSACDIRNIAIQLKYVSNVNGVCSAIFDLSYEQNTNNGNETAFIHLWNAASYPDLLGNGLAYTIPPEHPTEEDLKDAIANIIIEENGSPTPKLGISYMHEPTLPILLVAGMEVFKVNVDADWDRMTITNIPLTLSNCDGASIIADVWGCQAANNHNVHCYSTNKSFIVGNPVVSGFLTCTVPRKYNLGIENTGVADIAAVYKIYVDNGDKLYEPGSETLAFTSDEKTITAGNTFSAMNQSYPPYDNLKPYSDRGLWIEVTTTGFSNKSIYFLNNICAPLPVNYASFTANRNGEKVDLRWVTATETNNAGFEVQRQIGSGNFVTISTVASRAANGNSNAEISYTYTDPNPSHSVSIYRIRQIDLDGRYSYSDDRMVPGEGMGVHVYPNPVNTTNFYVVMEQSQQSHDVAMFDAYGRMVNQWFNVTSHELIVRKPSPGLYTIRVINRTTQQVATAKILVMAQ